MQMYSSKYALAGGIKEFAPSKVISDSDYVWDGPHMMLKIGREAFHTRAEAVADAENRRVKKIAALRKQIKKLEELSFT